jgi:pyruvate dehydrogenase E1 component beta subunit/2-oxoisovalerate dehydrogenase E1 component
MFDPQRYRDKSEVAQWREKGPIVRFQDWLLSSRLLHEGDLEGIEARVDKEIDAAVAFAEAARLEPLDDLYRHVYQDPAHD